MTAGAASVRPPEHLDINPLFWNILCSGQFGGTTLTEMQHRWTIRELLDATDVLAYNRAVEAAVTREAKSKAGA